MCARCKETSTSAKVLTSHPASGIVVKMPYSATPQQLETFKKNTDTRVKKYEADLVGLLDIH